MLWGEPPNARRKRSKLYVGGIAHIIPQFRPQMLAYVGKKPYPRVKELEI